MYGLVPYNLSPIQQGIQFGHAVQEYNNLVRSLEKDHVKGLILEKQDYEAIAAFEQWSLKDKTFIILNGGTTNNTEEKWGSLNWHLYYLKNAGIFTASFEEPDLGDQLTGVVFLVDDRVFDRENWPDCTSEDEAGFREWKMKFSDDEKEADRIVFLRNFLSKLRLA